VVNVLVSFSKLFLGWIFIVLGVAGLFLPILQGVLFLLLGFTLLSSESRWLRRRLADLRKYAPRQVARIRALRLRVYIFLARFKNSVS
jgi:uncharacterized membrane protein YbaN (DUF454 family)